jgi:ATP-binding cassette subfamily F protein uup
MPILSFAGLSFDIGDQPILCRAELTLEPGERVALIGRNGAGKSTLLRILEGELKPDSGEIRAKPGLRISRLAQLLPEVGDETIQEYVALGLSHLQVLLDRYHHRTASHMDENALKELEELQHRIDTEGGWNLERRIETILS